MAELLPAGLRASVVPQLDRLYAADPVPAVRADAMVVLARLGRDTAALDSPLPEVRLAAALLCVERSGPPYPAELVAVIAQDGAEPDPGDDDFPWSDTTTQEEQLTRLLIRDRDAGLTVAARWIAAGDLGSRGSWLAQKISETWRDQEPEVLELLLAALPHQRDAAPSPAACAVSATGSSTCPSRGPTSKTHCTGTQVPMMKPPGRRSSPWCAPATPAPWSWYCATPVPSCWQRRRGTSPKRPTN
ncbi:hypothetical protein AB0N14_37950 [Streptomyces sp. NPDC051104]|uniref:hypothetical protein n=1 Tax=Streptomyces sp. NPDC051104 TaxID=3155044 RepID=UPI0034262847